MFTAPATTATRWLTSHFSSFTLARSPFFLPTFFFQFFSLPIPPFLFLFLALVLFILRKRLIPQSDFRSCPLEFPLVFYLWKNCSLPYRLFAIKRILYRRIRLHTLMRKKGGRNPFNTLQIRKIELEEVESCISFLNMLKEV